MRLFSSLLTVPLLHSLGSVSGRSEIGLDGDVDGEGDLPRSTPEPLLYRDEFNYGSILMETRPGYPRNGTLPRGLGLGARQVTCNDGYVLACPPTKSMPCCPMDHPICCAEPSSTVCCSTGTFCNGNNTCCFNGQIPCKNPEGCCPGGSTCCGIRCCTGGSECRNGLCVNVSGPSLSVASVEDSISDTSSRSLENVASARSKSTETAATTETADGNSNTKVALVGGAVGGALGMTVLILICVLGVVLCRRRRRGGVPPIGRLQFVSQQPPSQPITPGSATFLMDSNRNGGHPVTIAAQPGYIQPGGGASAVQANTAPQRPAPNSLPVNKRAPFIQRGEYRQVALQSPPDEGPGNPRETSGNALRGSTQSGPAPMSDTYEPSEASGGTLSPAPPYSLTPPVHEKTITSR